MSNPKATDPLLPCLVIYDPTIQEDRQQCKLSATEKAKRCRQQTASAQDLPLYSEATAIGEAKKRCLNLKCISASPTEKQYLGQLILNFGKYQGQTFKWLLENDVGYVKYLVDKHVKEVRNTKRQVDINDRRLKDYLLKYVQYFPPVSSHLEMNVDKWVYGQGKFKHFTFLEMYQWYTVYKTRFSLNQDAGNGQEKKQAVDAYHSVKHWLEIDPRNIQTAALKRFRTYILDKEKEDGLSSSQSGMSSQSAPFSKPDPTSKLDPSAKPDPSTKSSPSSKSAPYTKSAPSSTSDTSPKPVSSSKSAPSSTSLQGSEELDSSWDDDTFLLELSNPIAIGETSSGKTLTTANKEGITSVTVIRPPQSNLNYEGWQKAWETGLPRADVHWLRNNYERGLFKQVEHYKQRTSKALCARHVLKNDRMWFYPPECPAYISSGPPNVDAFFRSRVFFWRPVGVWSYSFSCPRENCPGKGEKMYLYRCGYSSTVRYICDMDDWYCMLSEVLACSACTKAAKHSEDHHIGRFVAWEWNIISQLTPAHQALFPAVLTPRRGVDKKVVHLLCDRSEGNTMSKTWRQIQERHCQQYLYRKDLYTTLLESLATKESIVRKLGHRFQPPPLRRELPSAKLLRKAFLIAEALHIDDYRTQIMSVFGKVLKFDSTKKICKKLSGSGQGTAEWCTNIGNKHGQILNSVLTCEESVEMLQPMATALMNRYKRAEEEPPEIMYVDRGCCCLNGISYIERLFDGWVEAGMIVRLDIFHWINRFDAAVRTDHHSKYPLFKNALSAAVFAYNKEDMALLVKALRQGHPTQFKDLSDGQVIQYYASKDDLKHFVRRVTVGATETFSRVQSAIDIMKGAAGLDENGIHLFRDEAAIDDVWSKQQKHLECIQDPPCFNMYFCTKTVVRNGIALQFYRTVRGSNSLEGFHRFLPGMIPGPRCAAEPFQVYLLSGIVRWNSDRESASVKGQKGRKNRVYSSPLISRLNDRCLRLFGEVEETNYRPPVPAGEELIGLEYLFSQSEADFNTRIHYASTIDTLYKTVESVEDDEAVHSMEDDADEEDCLDDGYTSDSDILPITNLQLTDANVTAERDPCEEDVCGPHHLPGYQHVENLCSLLAKLALQDSRLFFTVEERESITAAWNKLEVHDRSIDRFDQLYTSRWGHAIFGRTKGDLYDVSPIQKIKFGKRYAPAHLVNPRKNRLVYCLLKQLWLLPDCSSQPSSPQKQIIAKMYQWLQQRITVDDPELSKLGIPLIKINSKTVADFIHKQEKIAGLNVTEQGEALLRRHQSVCITPIQPAEVLPDVRPTTSRPAVTYPCVPNMAGTRTLKMRTDARELIQLPPRQNPAPLVLSTSAAAVSVLPPGQAMARSTAFKRRKQNNSLKTPSKRAFMTYTCQLCSKTTQGHSKYRKKSFCPITNKSTSKGFADKTFESFQAFKDAVDEVAKP